MKFPFIFATSKSCAKYKKKISWKWRRKIHKSYSRVAAAIFSSIRRPKSFRHWKIFCHRRDLNLCVWWIKMIPQSSDSQVNLVSIISRRWKFAVWSRIPFQGAFTIAGRFSSPPPTELWFQHKKLLSNFKEKEFFSLPPKSTARHPHIVRHQRSKTPHTRALIRWSGIQSCAERLAGFIDFLQILAASWKMSCRGWKTWFAFRLEG